MKSECRTQPLLQCRSWFRILMKICITKTNSSFPGKFLQVEFLYSFIISSPKGYIIVREQARSLRTEITVDSMIQMKNITKYINQFETNNLAFGEVPHSENVIH